MMNQPSPEVRQRLRAMCAQMAVVQHLEEEIQRELYGHMEDKLLAYLNGEETITEEDALILVREHFGDPVVLKGLLHAAHPVAAASHFLRRVVAVICAQTVFLFLAGLLFKTAVFLFSKSATDTASGTFLYSVLPQLLRLSVLCLLWFALRFWQGQIDRGRSVWFLDYPGWMMACLGVGTCTVGLLYGAAQPVIPMVTQYFIGLPGYPMILTMLYTVCSGFLWMGWCDRPPRLRASVLAAFGVWAVFEFLLTAPPHVLWMVTRPGSLAPQTVEGMVRHIVNGTLTVFAAGLCAMAVHGLLCKNAGGTNRMTEWERGHD